MANSRDILLKLVSIAMGWENDFSLHANVDWKDVLSLAHEQGVNAIAGMVLKMDGAGATFIVIIA